ncbi:MAG: beta-lactamase family protein [Sphingomonas sp.]|nr:beta-lactamase family protein [Sphingomonas sp.]
MIKAIVALGAVAFLVGAGVMASRTAGDATNEAVESTLVARARLATVAPAERRDIDYQALDARLQRLMAEPAMVGLAVGIVENGRIIFLRGYGETVAGSGEKVTPQTVFRWASVSKGVASTMVAKLAEQGKVSLTAPIAQYSPIKLPAGAEQQATVGDVLSHRLGLYRNAYDNKLEEGQDPAFLRQTLAHLNLICAPASCWSYQNVAFDAASDVVARGTGVPYQDAVEEMLFRPIGMNSASITREGLMASPSWARPHSAGGRELEVNDIYYRVPAAGGVNSNIKDLSLWMLTQVGAMPDVVSPRVLQVIQAPLVKTPGQRGRLRKFLERLGDTWYGYGWRSYDYAGHRVVGHRGGVNGYRSLILFDPAKKSGVVAMWNSSVTQPAGLEFEVMDMIHRLPFRDWLQLDEAARATVVEDPLAANSGEIANRSR